jgi:hypothetical protein
MPYLLFASPGTSSIPLPPFGTVFLDPATAFQVATASFPASGMVTLGAPVPNNSALIGQTIYWQAGIPSQLRLTNRETTTVTGL